MMFRYPIFDSGTISIPDPVCEDSLWKNTAASAFNFCTIQAKLKGLFEELKRLEKDFLQQDLPDAPLDMFRRLFERI